MNVDLNILKIFEGCLMLIWIDVDNKEITAVVKEWNEVNIPIIYNIFSEWEVKLSKLNIDIHDNSWMFIIMWWISWEDDLWRMIMSTNNIVVFFGY